MQAERQHALSAQEYAGRVHALIFVADSESSHFCDAMSTTFDTFNPSTQRARAHLSRRPCVSNKLRVHSP